jgi:hypothetical protein
MKSTFRQRTALGPLEDLGWTALSIAAALVLLPAIGFKAMAQAVLPEKPSGEHTEGRST